MAGGFGNIGTAHITVELDFDRAVQEARTAGTRLATPFGAAGEESAVAFGRTLATGVAAGAAAAGKEASAALGASAGVGAAKAGTTAGAAFGTSMARSIGVSVAAARARIASGFASTVPVARAAGLRAGRAFGRSLEGTVSTSLRFLTSKTAALGAAFAGALAAGKSVKTVQELGRTQKLLGDNFGFTTKAAGEYAAIAKVLDVDQKKLSLGLTSLARNSVAAAAGSKKQKDAFKALGISQKLLKSGDTNAIFEETAERLKAMEGGTKKAALAQAIFGRGALSLRPIIKGGRDGIRELRGEAEKFGTVLSDPEAVSKFTKSTHALRFALLGAQVQLGQRLIPALTIGITKFSDFVATSKPFHRILRGIGSIISGVARGVVGFAKSFAKAFSKEQGKGAQDISTTIKELGESVGAFAAKWLPRLGTAIGTLAGFIQKGRNIITELFPALGKFSLFIPPVFALVAAVVSAIIKVDIFRRGIVRLARVLEVGVLAAILPARLAIVTLARAFVAGLGIIRKAITVSNMFIRLVFGQIKFAIAALGSTVRAWASGVRTAFVNVGNAVRSWYDRTRALLAAAVERFRGFVSGVRATLSNFSLFNLGHRIMLGLRDGLEAGFESVKKFVRSIAGIIKSLKGPISFDRTLLVDEGRAIMGGFEKGLKSRWRGVRDWVSNIGGFFKGAISPESVRLDIANILLGKGSVADLNKNLGNQLDIPLSNLTAGVGLGFLHPTSGWADTLNQVRLIEKLFNVGMTSGFRSYDTVPGPGVSQHTLGQAADFGTSRASGASLTRLATFMSKIVPQVMKQVIWLNSLWQGGTPGHGFVGGHMDHVHLGWQPRAAGGGVRKGQGYRWNERGAETLIPHGNGYVMNAGRTKELVSALKAIAQQGGRGSGQTDNRVQTVNLITNGDGRGARPMLEAVFARA